MNRELLQQALDAFEAIMFTKNVWSSHIIAKNARYALREELAKLEQSKYSDIVSDGGLDPRNKFDAQPEQELDYPPECTTPELEVAYAAGWWKALEVQRNKQPEQEPIAWGYRDKNGDIVDCLRKKTIDHDRSKAIDYDIPLYTAPPKRKWVGLTDDEIFEIWEIGGTELESVRAIEAKLREKNG